MDQDFNTPVSLYYMIHHLTGLMQDQKRIAEGDYSNQLNTERNLQETKALLGQFRLDLDVYGWQLDKNLEGKRFEEVSPIPSPSPVVPQEGMPWNIPNLHSPDHKSARDFITQDALYHMTQGEDPS